MRRAALAALLACMAMAPALAQPPTEAPPSLEVVHQPTYVVGDTWTYRLTALTQDRVNTSSLDQTVVVEALEEWHGMPSYRLRTEASQFVPARPEDQTQTSTRDASTQTTWMTRDGLEVLRTERVAVRNQSGPFFTFLTFQEENWTFDPPRDDYQFPILGPGGGREADAWVIVANATVERNTTYATKTSNRSEESPKQASNSSVHQVSQSAWLRTQRIPTPAGDLDVVVLQTLSGNATIFDSWAPAAGNLARRDILNETGRVVQTVVLTNYTYQNAPAPPPPLRPTHTDPPGWLPYAGAAVVGVLAASLAVAVWKRRAQRGQRPAPGPEAGAEAGGAEGDAGAPGEGAGGDAPREP